MEYADRKTLLADADADKEARQRLAMKTLIGLDDAIKKMDADREDAVARRDALWKGLLAEEGGRQRPLNVLYRQLRYEATQPKPKKRPDKEASPSTI